MPHVPRLLPEIEFNEMLVKLLCGVSLYLETAFDKSTMTLFRGPLS